MTISRGSPIRQEHSPPRLDPTTGSPPALAPLDVAKTILVLSPDGCRSGELVQALQRRGLPAVQAGSLEEATYWTEEAPPVLAILDLRAQRWRPVLAALRSAGRLIVAVTNDPAERRMALEAGCVDATSRTVDADEMALKAYRLVRERRVVRTFTGAAGPLEVDLGEGRLRWRGEDVRVPPQVLMLAAVLIAHAGRPVATPTLLQELWQDPWSGPDRLHKTIWRLRRALGLPRDSGFLCARRGYGYGIFPDADAANDAPVQLKTIIDDALGSGAARLTARREEDTHSALASR